MGLKILALCEFCYFLLVAKILVSTFYASIGLMARVVLLFFLLLVYFFLPFHHLSLKLATKAKTWKGPSWECNPRITFAPQGMWRNEPTHSQVDSHFGSWNFYGVPNLQRSISGSKLIGLKSSLYHLKALETYMSKMGLHNSFEYLKNKLWPKEGSGVKVPIWL
jgi:hypothetical protein